MTYHENVFNDYNCTFGKTGIMVECLKKEFNKSEKLQYILQTIYDNPYEGILVVDEHGYIVMINRAYCEFLGVDSNEVKGKNVKDVVENTRLHIVIGTRKPEVFQLQKINNRNILCNRIPIMQNGELIGAYCHILFQDTLDLKALAKRIAYLQSELEYYKNELTHHQDTRYTIDSIVGNSIQIRELKESILKVAGTQSNVLIRGESGTGKELVAHSIHARQQPECKMVN